MEEEAACRRSVAELAGRFKGTAPQHDATGQESEKPVRRRPPRSLQLHKTTGDDQEPPSVTSPLPSKAKRNSALIEKLQANLALSPGALTPSPKSPGFRMFPPAFPLLSPGSALVTTVTTPSTPPPTSPVPTSPLTEEEGPASFEDPPVVSEEATLANANIKARARHSLRRRPPSRRHRQSGGGEDVSNVSEGGGASLHSEEKEEGGGEDQQDGKPDEEEDETGSSTSHNERKTQQEETAELKHSTREEDKEEIKNGSPEGESDDRSSETKAEEETEDIERRGDVTEKARNSNSDEVERMKSEEATSPRSVR